MSTPTIAALDARRAVDELFAAAPDRDRRAAAAERAAAMALPTAEQEVWRYSRIDEFDPARLRPATVRTTATGADALTVDEAAVERVLCVLAHPDDVDFGSAGTVATWTAAGTEVTYCIVTDGDAGGFGRGEDAAVDSAEDHEDRAQCPARVLGRGPDVRPACRIGPASRLTQQRQGCRPNGCGRSNALEG